MMADKLKKAAVIGWPVTHSKSPLIHGYWIDQYGIEGSYEAIGLSPEEFRSGIQNLVAWGYRGCNVTIPHKEAALSIADSASDRAMAIGAANTFVFKDGKIHADNTDGIGFISNIEHSAPDWDASKGTVLVLGAGGAARAIVYALLQAGAPKIFIANRTIEKAQTLAEFFGDKAIAISMPEIADVMEKVKTLVNTTSLGMTGQPDLQIDISALPKSALITDIVYNPLETELLKQANALGLKAVDGLGMLLHQAAPGFEAWFGVRPKVDETLRRIVLAAK